MPTVPPPPKVPSNAVRSSRPPRGDEPVESGSFLLRFGTGVGAGVVAASLAVVPAAMRVSAATVGASGARVWLSCVALALLPMLVSVWILRRARVGLRSFGRADTSARSVALAAWLLASFVFLSAFGSVLRATTHHHALAGVTFAIVGLVVVVVLAVLSARFADLLASRKERTRRVLVIATGVVLMLVLVVVGMRFARAFSAPLPEPSNAGALFVDVFAFGIAALFASRPSFAGRRALAIAGVPVAVAVFAAGLLTLHGSTELAASVSEHAPLLVVVSGVLAWH